MNILAFDTVSSSFSIALQKEDNSIVEYNKENVKNHNEEILSVLHKFLEENSISLDKIDYIVLGIGPGSFTALRIAFSTVKTICYAKNIPIIGISSLESLYENIKDYSGIKASMIDARKGSIYADIYSGNKKLRENLDLTYDEFIDIINSIDSNDKTLTLCGDGFFKNQDYLKEKLKNYKINDLDKSFNIIKASNCIKLSIPRIKSNNFDDIFNLLPLYIRKSEAENKK
ncbi:tRNA (adenosine(37)-N6)-threonylcarbamoyltransferase complex dimerization subunit type 1 TsaB [Brachyspira hyodysenteriae]|uniref:tRNA (adenosine(37)-N6)-threonylcarbamoyltransferase complex dimerization subunit type 1 TsaB n=1 Tax=Brachyspira hyodysenteriae TaxID=159 RepID=UPI00063DC757|nr:tRNA (adenosine(37)-N6)-threonylcarbamoyltransferase complex dimerization subunit type 1 TsaB [Brachyspira hyodysenteriae]KLI21898.1 peptidase [Brachyspira hyodysenteriae]KLI29957.1 peptidase [Brachyspira hyodysenteriae]KLI38491.1 peptidase [Brachyspira hyodysenteriae]MCZ9840012.1 tRNA (adenosine(37)-N6)-threonylcarbamoyltransferase complex dimerization subunit type 1 TsaB [Brachyspira hyodysenteriae]MCZ9848411.1 tRNA (adenosine(37)-N6)-threonylcarbamoyltransferase complex dimerization subu